MNRLILASKSKSRADLLHNAGINFEIYPSGVDEDAVKSQLTGQNITPLKIAEALADAKALSVAIRHDGWVIGADQTLELDGELFDKPVGLTEIRRRLETLRGREHSLHTAISVARSGTVLWRYSITSTLIMRQFSEYVLNKYIDRHGEGLGSSVGAYRLEDDGIQLFDSIGGDYFSILGLPLLEMTKYLRSAGILES